MRFILSLLITTTAILANAQTSGKQAQFNSVWGIDYNSNMVKQPSAQKNVLDVVLNGGATATRDTGVGDRIDNIASYEFVLPAMASVEILLNPPNDDQTSGNCGGSGEYKTTGSGLVAEITDGSSNRLNFVTLPSSSGWRSFKIPQVTCAASGARRMYIGNPTGSSITVNMGKFFYGRMEPGAGVPTNTFTAEISTTGTVSQESGGDWINGNCSVSDTSLYTCNFNAGIFSLRPNCWAYAARSGDGGTVPQLAYNTNNSTSQIIVRTGTPGTKQTLNFGIACEKQGSDYIQPAVTAQNWNFDWKDCPSGFDDNWTNTTVTCKWKRQGGQGYFQFKMTATGTPTGSSYAITLPTGITQDQTRMTQTVSGNYAMSGNANILDNGSRFYLGSVTSVSASTFTVNSLQEAPVSSLWETPITPSLPMSWVSGDGLTIYVNFPVSENGVPWTETWNALQLVGSYTADDNSAIETFTWSSETTCSAGTCVKSSSIGNKVSSVAFSSTGVYNITFTGLSNKPNWCDCQSAGANTQQCSIFPLSSTSGIIRTHTVGGTVQNYDLLNFKCDVKR